MKYLHCYVPIFNAPSAICGFFVYDMGQIGESNYKVPDHVVLTELGIFVVLFCVEYCGYPRMFILIFQGDEQVGCRAVSIHENHLLDFIAEGEENSSVSTTFFDYPLGVIFILLIGG